MSDQSDWYFQQPVQENELDAAFAALETADLQQALDWGIAAKPVDSNHGGIMAGLTVTNPSGVNVDVQAGAAYDDQGRRVALSSQNTIDLSKTGDTNIGGGGTPLGGVSTDPGAGNRRWVTLFIVFDRVLQEPRTDGLGAPIFFERLESYLFTVAMGVPAVTPTDQSPLEAGKLLLGDFRVTDAGTIDLIQIDRRQVWLRARDSDSVPVTRVNGNTDFPIRGMEEGEGIRAAIERLLGFYNDHVRLDGNVGDQHAATSVLAEAIAGSPVSVSQDTVGGQLATIVAELNNHINGSYDHPDSEITSAASAGSPHSLSGGNVRTHLLELQTATNTNSVAANLSYASGPNWKNGETNPATTVQAQLDKIISDLANPTGVGASGGYLIGLEVANLWADGASLSADNVGGAIGEIVQTLELEGAPAKIGGVAAYDSTGSSSTGLSAGSLADQLKELADQQEGAKKAFARIWSSSDIATLSTGLPTALDIAGSGEWWIMVGVSTDTRLGLLFTHHAGSAWRENFTGDGPVLRGATWDPVADKFLVAGDGGIIKKNFTFMDTWLDVSGLVSTNLRAIYTDSSGVTIAAGEHDGSAITTRRSTDATTFVAASTPMPGGVGDQCNSIHEFDGVWIAVGEASNGDPLLWRSTDSGDNWSSITPAATTTDALVAVTHDGTFWFAAGDDGELVRGGSNGVTWTEVTTNLDDIVAVGEVTAMKADPVTGIMIAATGNETSLLISEDAGVTWEALRNVPILSPSQANSKPALGFDGKAWAMGHRDVLRAAGSQSAVRV